MLNLKQTELLVTMLEKEQKRSDQYQYHYLLLHRSQVALLSTLLQLYRLELLKAHKRQQARLNKKTSGRTLPRKQRTSPSRKRSAMKHSGRRATKAKTPARTTGAAGRVRQRRTLSGSAATRKSRC